MEPFRPVPVGLDSEPGSSEARGAAGSPAVVVALVAAALLGFSLSSLPDTMGDLGEYCRWTRRLVAHGLEGAYFALPGPAEADGSDPTSPIDYPPVLPYLLWSLGHAVAWLAPRLLAHDVALGFLIRVPLVVAHLALGVVLYRYALGKAGPGVAAWVLVAHLFNPALLFDTCYWGQADSLVALALVASIVSATRGRLEWAWVLLVVTALLKPLAYPYFVLLAVVTWRQSGLRRTLRCAAFAFAACLALLIPFLCVGRLNDILRWIALQLGSMPYASANAHNLWWLVTGGLPWTPAGDSLLWRISYQQVGLLLFAAVLGFTALQLWRARTAESLPLAAAGTALAFFVLNTHLHETHLFVFLPLLALLTFRDGRFRWMYAVATFTVLANMALHDPYLRFVLGPHLPGPRLILPEACWSPDPNLATYFLKHGYAHRLEVLKGLTTPVWLAFTMAVSQVNVLLLLIWLGCALRGWRRTGESLVVRHKMIGLSLLVATMGLGGIFAHQAAGFVKRQYFLTHLDQARATGGAEPRRWGVLGRWGSPRWVIMAPPPSELRYSLLVPAGAKLTVAPAIEPAGPGESGGRVAFQVELVSADGKETLWSASCDGSTGAVPVDLDLSRQAGRQVEIVLRTSSEAPGANASSVGWVEPGLL